jgi:hypothetical protein
VKHILQAFVPLILILAGCGDERAVKIATEAADRQAKQNDQIARIVNEETAFRQQAAKLQNDLRADQAAIARERDQLETERRQLAGQREWAVFYTPLLETIGVVAVVVAILLYCSFVVYGLRRDNGGDREVTELLLNDLVSLQPVLLPQLPTSPAKLRLPSPGRAAQIPR